MTGQLHLHSGHRSTDLLHMLVGLRQGRAARGFDCRGRGCCVGVIGGKVGAPVRSRVFGHGELPELIHGLRSLQPVRQLHQRGLGLVQQLLQREVSRRPGAR